VDKYFTNNRACVLDKWWTSATVVRGSIWNSRYHSELQRASIPLCSKNRPEVQ